MDRCSVCHGKKMVKNCEEMSNYARASGQGNLKNAGRWKKLLGEKQGESTKERGRDSYGGCQGKEAAMGIRRYLGF